LLGYHGCRNDNSEDSQLQHSSNQVAKLPVTRDSLPTLFAKELVHFQSLCASILIIGGISNAFVEYGFNQRLVFISSFGL
jgi:hypothetical protein